MIFKDVLVERMRCINCNKEFVNPSPFELRSHIDGRKKNKCINLKELKR